MNLLQHIAGFLFPFKAGPFYTIVSAEDGNSTIFRPNEITERRLRREAKQTGLDDAKPLAFLVVSDQPQVVAWELDEMGDIGEGETVSEGASPKVVLAHLRYVRDQAGVTAVNWIDESGSYWIEIDQFIDGIRNLISRGGR